MQQINLYQKEFQTSYNWRKIATIGSVVLLALIFFGININQIYTTNQLRTELASKKIH